MFRIKGFFPPFLYQICENLSKLKFIRKRVWVSKRKEERINVELEFNSFPVKYTIRKLNQLKTLLSLEKDKSQREEMSKDHFWRIEKKDYKNISTNLMETKKLNFWRVNIILNFFSLKQKVRIQILESLGKSLKYCKL